MKVLITGASGLIGSALAPRLAGGGHQVVRLTRAEQPGPDEFHWDPAAGEIDSGALDGVDAIVHLAGETVAGRWTDAKKQRIRDSRVLGTRLLAQAAAEDDPPAARLRVRVRHRLLRRSRRRPGAEGSPMGDGFLAGVVRDWEAAAEPAREAGIRVVNLRFGIVQSAAGGALRAQLPLFRLGLGGRVGNGRQYVSWVAIDDVVGAIEFALGNERLSGPANVSAPAARHERRVRPHARPRPGPPGRVARTGAGGAARAGRVLG